MDAPDYPASRDKVRLTLSKQLEWRAVPVHVPNYTPHGVSLTWTRAEQTKRLKSSRHRGLSE